VCKAVRLIRLILIGRGYYKAGSVRVMMVIGVIRVMKICECS
jgi:hypothetical protein